MACFWFSLHSAVDILHISTDFICETNSYFLHLKINSMYIIKIKLQILMSVFRSPGLDGGSSNIRNRRPSVALSRPLPVRPRCPLPLLIKSRCEVRRPSFWHLAIYLSDAGSGQDPRKKKGRFLFSENCGELWCQVPPRQKARPRPSTSESTLVK